MFWQEHAPPHFHALYGEFEALIDIRTLEVIRGSFPRRAFSLVMEWAAQHRNELELTTKSEGQEKGKNG